VGDLIDRPIVSLTALLVAMVLAVFKPWDASARPGAGDRQSFRVSHERTGREGGVMVMDHTCGDGCWPAWA
jgi:hypothetical protein